MHMFFSTWVCGDSHSYRHAQFCGHTLLQSECQMCVYSLRGRTLDFTICLMDWFMCVLWVIGEWTWGHQCYLFTRDVGHAETWCHGHRQFRCGACVHWTLCEASIFSCARNSEIIAAVLVGSVTNFDTVVAGFLLKLIFLGEGFAGVSIVWQVTSVHCLRFHWWVPSDLFRIWQDGFRVNGVIVEWLSGMGLACVVPCSGSMNWNLIEMMLSVILYGLFGIVDVTRN